MLPNFEFYLSASAFKESLYSCPNWSNPIMIFVKLEKAFLMEN